MYYYAVIVFYGHMRGQFGKLSAQSFFLFFYFFMN